MGPLGVSPRGPDLVVGIGCCQRIPLCDLTFGIVSRAFRAEGERTGSPTRAAMFTHAQVTQHPQGSL